MKRAKIMLIAIAIIATVGGALAFKAAKKFQPGNVYCKTIINGQTFCSLTTYTKDDTGLFSTTKPCAAPTYFTTSWYTTNTIANPTCGVGTTTTVYRMPND